MNCIIKSFIFGLIAAAFMGMLFGTIYMNQDVIQERRNIIQERVSQEPQGQPQFNDLHIVDTNISTELEVTEYSRFEEFLRQDTISERPYNIDKSKTYSEWYVCSHYTRDLIENATNAGFLIYGVRLTGLTEYNPAEDWAWHIVGVVRLDGVWYFIEPQTDEIIPISQVYASYGYEYAYIGKDILITRNRADISDPIRHETGLIDGDFIYLKP